jgi:hypothetical protein
MPCSPLKANQHFVWVKEAEQDTNAKEGGKLSNQLVGNFGLYRKQDGMKSGPQFPLACCGTE